VVPESQSATADLTSLLREWGEGRDEALRQLLPVAYERLRVIAGALMRTESADHTLQPTALVGELYVRLAGRNQAQWESREHFYRFCARAMRGILIDHSRRRLAEKRRIEFAGANLPEMAWLGRRQQDILCLDLVLNKLETLDPRKLKVLELRLFLGAGASETAEILGLSKATVDRELRLTRAWVFRELRTGEPAP
jgi:RNA polymerase sigma factor (TIGR02999 family)